MKYNTKSLLLTFLTAFCLSVFLPTSTAAKYSAYVKKIESKAVFESLQGEPLHHKYGQVYAVKVMQDVHSKKVYFINSNDYKYHYRFAIDYLHFYGDLTRFNDCNYSDVTCRNYVLATINYYTAIDKYTLEFSSTETLTASNFELYAAIKELIYFPENFYLYPSTSLHRQNIIDQKISIPVITPDEIYGGLVYQPVHQTYSYGKLKFRTLESLKNNPINETDIVVLQGSPNQLDICAGVITVDFQTPLSHISILCQNRNIPLMALKNAWENSALRAFEDSLVKFSVNQDTFSIAKASTEDFEKYQKKKLSNKKEIQLEKRLEVTKLVPLWNLNYESVDFVGGKAANFGELNKILKKDTTNLFAIPSFAFAIPFYFYDEHIKRSGADTLISKLSIFSGERTKLDSLLELIQVYIYQTPLNFKLYQSIVAEMTQNKCNSLRFRSSTNAEDIKGFNGAGLYESATGSLLSKKKTIEKAIKTVWASAWNSRAFQERNYFNINQQTVAMGILAHENFPDELINGVALTSNLYRDDMGGYTINCQLGEESIVHPKEGMQCEQFILFDEWEFHKTNTVADFISFSSLHPASSLLSSEEIEHLKLVLRTIKQHFYYNIPNNKSNGYSKFTLDVEFKFVGAERKLIIKQVRYY